MTTMIRLVGPPSIERDGVAVASPRGRKAWALLAYLVLAERPVTRQQLAELLFPDADDPLGALRWSLTELRRAIGVAGALTGDPVSVGLDADVELDIGFDRGASRDPSLLLLLDGDLLEGINVTGCPAFESWLIVERFRMSSAIESQLREAAISLGSQGFWEAAVPYAARAVSRNLLDEANHELLVRCLAGAGDDIAAQRQIDVCEDLLRRELGVAASPALRAAARVANSRAGIPVHERSAITGLVEAGRAAMAAGALDAGLACLEQAVSRAAAAGEGHLHGRALAALGGALVHGVRGRDGEGSLVLHDAVEVASRAGDRATIATACREIGFVEVQAGRRATAKAWLDRSTDVAETDEERAALLGVQGMDASDRADYPMSVETLRRSIELAARCGDVRQEAWSLSILGRLHLLRDERSQATTLLDRSIRLCEEHRWRAFLPWPAVLRAEIDLREGRLDEVHDRLEHSWALSCQLGDPCWQGMTARCTGLVALARGDHAAAATWMDEAYRWSGSVTDRYQWVKAYVLDAMVHVAAARGAVDDARRRIDELALLSARCELRELVARAHLARARLDGGVGLHAARVLGRDIDNPALAHTLAHPDEGEPGVPAWWHTGR